MCTVIVCAQFNRNAHHYYTKNRTKWNRVIRCCLQCAHFYTCIQIGTNRFVTIFCASNWWVECSLSPLMRLAAGAFAVPFRLRRRHAITWLFQILFCSTVGSWNWHDKHGQSMVCPKDRTPQNVRIGRITKSFHHRVKINCPQSNISKCSIPLSIRKLVLPPAIRHNNKISY